MSRKATRSFHTDTASQSGDRENQMSYTIASDLKVCGKNKGDSITKEELLKAGANINALIESGHLKSDIAALTPKPALIQGVTK